MMNKKVRFMLAGIVLAIVPFLSTIGQFGPPVKQAVQQHQFHIQIQGISAVQLAWWFQSIADKNGVYWEKLSPANKSINWVVTPTDDAHQIIGSLFESDQSIPGGLFNGDNLHMQIQYGDYFTGDRGRNSLMPTQGFPSDYTAPYPSPEGGFGFGTPIASENNGFNEDMLFFDGHGFCPGRILWSWKNTGNDDTKATEGQPSSIDLYCTFYLTSMDGANRPPSMTFDGYYFTKAQVDAIWAVWQQMLTNMTSDLPSWFGKDTQDDIARTKGWTVQSIINTGVLAGANSKMEVWWWMHGMGDDPGNAYVFWHPTVHHTIRWLPGYSPADVAKEQGLGEVPSDVVLPGIIYPDLQGGNLVQDGGGMMAYSVSMSPVPGVYKTLNPMMVVRKSQVDAWEAGTGPRFPEPFGWLLHQWEDVPGGLIHRSTGLSKLPLRMPVTQAGFYSEHQLQEGLWKGLEYLPKLYNNWLKTQSK